jgi:hypothetical protein
LTSSTVAIAIDGQAGRRPRRCRRPLDNQGQQLRGQCCDRRRPSFLRRRLEQTLLLHTAAGAALVDWRWDNRAQHVSGLEMENNQLRASSWWPGLNRFLPQRGLVPYQQQTPRDRPAIRWRNAIAYAKMLRQQSHRPTTDCPF